MSILALAADERVAEVETTEDEVERSLDGRQNNQCAVSLVSAPSERYRRTKKELAN